MVSPGLNVSLIFMRNQLRECLIVLFRHIIFCESIKDPVGIDELVEGGY